MKNLAGVGWGRQESVKCHLRFNKESSKHQWTRSTEWLNRGGEKRGREGQRGTERGGGRESFHLRQAEWFILGMKVGE